MQCHEQQATHISRTQFKPSLKSTTITCRPTDCTISVTVTPAPTHLEGGLHLVQCHEQHTPQYLTRTLSQEHNHYPPPPQNALALPLSPRPAPTLKADSVLCSAGKPATAAPRMPGPPMPPDLLGGSGLPRCHMSPSTPAVIRPLPCRPAPSRAPRTARSAGPLHTAAAAAGEPGDTARALHHTATAAGE